MIDKAYNQKLFYSHGPRLIIKRGLKSKYIFWYAHVCALKMFCFSLKGRTSLIIDHFEIPALFASLPAGKNSENFKIVDDKTSSIL